MKRALLIGVTAAVAVAGGLTGCSNSKSGPGAAGSSGAPLADAVTVDGQKQNVSGSVSCQTSGDNINIGFGDPNSASNGIGAVVTSATPPDVHAVGLGVVNGVTLGYSDAVSGQGSASVTLTGKSYKITGTAVGVDPNSQQQVSKSFELDLTCP
ncbi:lipoprotein LpqH [Mycobacteroides franklinii]|uniref:lipoprotein LpqH n=1 Tax=Mycobacteroides franklinii TaxID=948102 RepID=UPI001E63292B|nr:lipoprotein LpqH [Mycobacteroides franklinii]